MSYASILDMTIKQTLQTIRKECPTLTASYKSEYKEYRIAYKRVLCISAQDCENSAYYTDNSDDAIKTARYMHERHGK